MAERVLSVFLSSTGLDLTPFREEIYARLISTGLFLCRRMEDFGAQDAGAVEYCQRTVKKCDLFVGLVGLRRGWEPDGHDLRSITEMEHGWARDAGVKRYIWVTPDNLPIPGDIWEPDEVRARQQAFRKGVMAHGERIVSRNGFASPDRLASDVVERLLVEIVTTDLIRELRPELAVNPPISSPEEQKPAVAAAVEKLAEDRDIDLLALARNPEGADIAELEQKLRARAEEHGAAAAEYWRHIGALAFLHDTQKALAAYEKATAFDPAHPDGWRYLGELQYRLGDLDAAEASFSKLRDMPDELAQSMGFLRLGWILHTRGDLSASEAMRKRALEIAEAVDWSEGMARAYGNLGVIYHTRGELDLAEEMQSKALTFDEELGRKEGMARAYGNLANIYHRKNDWRRMCECGRKERDLWREMGLMDKAAEVERWLTANGCGEGEPGRDPAS
jgi:tetratricopeptide (TPR) repeat protein